MTGYRTRMARVGILVFGIVIVAWLLAHPCTAIEPTWTYKYTDAKEISDVEIAPDGSAIIAGAGKVMLFSRNGEVLERVPYGDILTQAPDGYFVTGYSSSIYMFEPTTDSEGKMSVKRLWTADLPSKVFSCSMDEGHQYVVVRTVDGNVAVYNATGVLYGRSTDFSDLVTMSPYFEYIAGISVNHGMMVYSGPGSSKQYEVDPPLNQIPKSIVGLPGDTIVFNQGQYIVAINTTVEDEDPNIETTWVKKSWETKATDDVNVMAISGDYQHIVAGTSSGGLNLLTTDGKRVWSYESKTASGSGSQGVNAVAITPDASRILAGTYDGKIFLVNGSGRALWTYSAPNEHIWSVAISPDGTLTAAAGENSMYVFSMADSWDTTAPVYEPEEPENMELPEDTGTGYSSEPLTGTNRGITTVPLERPTSYSVIRTQKSPFDSLPLIGALIAVFVIVRYRKTSR